MNPFASDPGPGAYKLTIPKEASPLLSAVYPLIDVLIAETTPFTKSDKLAYVASGKIAIDVPSTIILPTKTPKDVKSAKSNAAEEMNPS